MEIIHLFQTCPLILWSVYVTSPTLKSDGNALSSCQVVSTKEVISVGVNRHLLTQHLQTSFPSSHFTGNSQACPYLQDFPWGLQPNSSMGRFLEKPRASQTCPPFYNPERSPGGQMSSGMVCPCLLALQLLFHAIPMLAPIGVLLLCILETFLGRLVLLGPYPVSNPQPRTAPTLILGTRDFHNLWGSEPGATEVTKSLAGKEQE